MFQKSCLFMPKVVFPARVWPLLESNFPSKCHVFFCFNGGLLVPSPVGIYTPSRRAKHSSTGRTQFVYLVVQKQHDNTLASPKAATSAQDPTDQLVSKQWAADFINQECGMIVGVFF